MKTVQLLMLTSILTLGLFSACSKDDDSTTINYTGIYFQDASNEDIETLTMTGSTPSVLIEAVWGAGIAYDKIHEKIFYSTFTDEDNNIPGKIWTSDVDGKNAKTIVTDIYDPHQIAIDSKSGKVYWGDTDGNLSRCNLDGTAKENIVTIDTARIRAVAIDGTNNKLYFYDVQNNLLYKANLDGSSKSIILSGYYGYAIAVDEKNNKIYFDAQTDDETVSALYRANLDGSNPTLIADAQSKIYGIAIDTYKDKIYWSERSNSVIYQANLNGTNKVAISNSLGSPRGIFLKY